MWKAACASAPEGGACLRIQVDDNSLERPFYLKIIDSNDGSSGTVFVTQKLTPVYRLRQKAGTALVVGSRA